MADKLIFPSIDIHRFFSDGFAVGALDESMANYLGRRAIRPVSHWVDMPADHCDAGPREIADLEVEASSKRVLDSLYEKLIDRELKPLADLYRVGSTPHTTTLLRLGEGYWLDWHNHLSSGGAASVLVYLFSDEDPGVGGDLVIGRLGSDLQSIEEVGRVKPKHGTVVLLGDSAAPLLQHKAESWRPSTPGGQRYLVSFGFNSEDW